MHRSAVVALVLTVSLLALPPAAVAQDDATEDRAKPPRDPIGGFAVGGYAGSQFVGSTSLQAGFVVSYFLPPNASYGFEVEGGMTFGPNGNVSHGLFNVVFQTGARSSRIAPYAVFGVGYYRAELDLLDAQSDALTDFGIVITDTEEQGPLLGFGIGIRYFLSETMSARFDWREFRAIRDSEQSFFDKLFSMRRFAGIVMFEF